MQKKIRGFILRKNKYSESDLIIHLLASDGRKISFLAKGALKSKKRFAGGVLEPTHFIEAQYQEKNKDQLKLLDEAVIINDFPNLRTDYDRLSMALYFLEVISKISQEGDSGSESLFNLIGNTLKALESAKRLDLLKIQFSLKLLHQQGILEVENWMKTFLSTQLKDIEVLSNQFGNETNKYLNWCEQAVSEYTQTAEKF